MKLHSSLKFLALTLIMNCLTFTSAVHAQDEQTHEVLSEIRDVLLKNSSDLPGKCQLKQGPVCPTCSKVAESLEFIRQKKKVQINLTENESTKVSKRVVNEITTYEYKTKIDNYPLGNVISRINLETDGEQVLSVRISRSRGPMGLFTQRLNCEN